MIERVDVRNGQGALLTLTLDDPSSGFLIEDIGGLGPVKATLVSSSFAGVDGESYQSSRREGRDVTFKINLEPDYVTETVSQLRWRLYNWFMTKAWVSLRFYLSEGFYVDIEGRVESFDPELFTDEPNVNISVRCFKPDFVDPNTVLINGMTTALSTGSTIDYAGSVETGVLFTMNVNRALTEFSIYNTPTDGILRTLEFAAPLQAGDVLQISTVQGAKGAILTRGTTASSILYGISPESDWINFFTGPNSLRVYAVGAAIPYTIQYTTKYGGL